MDKKIVKFPIGYKERKINEMGEGYVPCEVSSRWLQFNEASSLCQGSEFIEFSVMTLDKNEAPYRMCNLIVTREDLERALRFVKPIEKTE